MVQVYVNVLKPFIYNGRDPSRRSPAGHELSIEAVGLVCLIRGGGWAHVIKTEFSHGPCALTSPFRLPCFVGGHNEIVKLILINQKIKVNQIFIFFVVSNWSLKF